MLFRTLGLVACLASAGFALDIHGRIVWNEICPGLNNLGPAKVVLDSGHHYGSVSASGDWTILDVPQGTYLLTVLSHDHTFDHYRVDVPKHDENSTNVKPTVRPHSLGTPLSPPSDIKLNYPMVLIPRISWKRPLAGSSGDAPAYYVPPESFNLIGMFKNPMMLMMVFAGGMMLLMPYLMKNMDPEALEEIQNRQAKMSSVQSAMSSGDFKSGFSALLGDDEPPKSVGPSPSKGSSKAGPSRGRGRRR